MTLTKRGRHRHGLAQEDIREELVRYSRANGYLATRFANATCTSGGRIFRLSIDDVEGAAVRRCEGCPVEHPMGDSAEYLDGASLEACACPCGAEVFEVSVGLSLYDPSEAVRWIYIGARCPSCGIAAIYGDWKNELEDARELLGRV